MIYFDHAATTPLDEKVLEAMTPYIKEEYGNPSSLHAYGRDARAAVEHAREKIALTLNSDPKEIVFTSGGTESVNAVLKGMAFANQGKPRHFIISAVEHHCVLDCTEWLTRLGCSISVVGVDSGGWVDPRDVEKAIRPGETTLISIMAANNEVGTIQSFKEIGALAKSHGIPFHTDAVQAYGKVHLDVERYHLSFLSASGHKIYGPKGAGFFYQRKGMDLVPLQHGGGQERGRRGGTENVAGIVGLGEAARRICSETSEQGRLRALAQMFLDEMKKTCPELRVNGPLDPEKRLPGILNITLPGVEGETLVHSLDNQGFAVSSGSACAAGAAEASHVLMAMGRSQKEAKEGLRFSFGRFNTGEQIRELLAVMPSVIQKLQMMTSFLEGNEPELRPDRS